jgi:ankyrin repeat protein
MPRGSDLNAAVAALDRAALERYLKTHRGPIPPRAIVDAGRLAWKPGLALLHKHGGDLNASYRNYRAIHSLIQEKPHEGGSSTTKRIACLEWLLMHGADPELTGAWPAVRAIIVAAFTGKPAYVNVLKSARARLDVFAFAALGDAKRVRTLIEKDATVAAAHDEGGVTALHCCAGSRLGRANKKIARGLFETARALVEAGANVNETVRSWGQDVDVMTFAIGSEQVDLITLLLDHGADPTAALPAAVWRQDYMTAELLLARGGSIDRATDRDRPILNELIRWGQFKPAIWLLEKGASPHVKDARGWNALDQARSRGNKRMMQLVMEAQARASEREPG